MPNSFQNEVYSRFFRILSPLEHVLVANLMHFMLNFISTKDRKFYLMHSHLTIFTNNRSNSWLTKVPEKIGYAGLKGFG